MTDMVAGTIKRSAQIRQKLAFVRAHDRRGRTARFCAQYLQQPAPLADPDFAVVAAVPKWLLLNTEDQMTLAVRVAILAHRTAIVRELSGSKLAALAERVGVDCFDQLCDLDELPPFDDPRFANLPRPEDLPMIGEALILLTGNERDDPAQEAQHAHRLCSAAYRTMEMAI